MRQAFIRALLLMAIVLAPAVMRAQGIPTGSTKIAEPPDSAFNEFLLFLKGRGATVIRTDSSRHRVEAKVKGSEESVLFMFTGAGDSTAVSAQGTKGGMAAIIMGLGEVNDWLESRRAQTSPPRKP